MAVPCIMLGVESAIVGILVIMSKQVSQFLTLPSDVSYSQNANGEAGQGPVLTCQL